MLKEESKMKKSAILSLPFAVMLLVAVLSTSALAASVGRNMPSRVSPGEAFAITFSVSGVNAGELFTLEDKLPNGWQLTSWDVSGAKGGKAAVSYRAVPADNRYGFSFTTESASPLVTLNAKVPAAASPGAYSFDAVYFDSSGQGKAPGSLTVRNIACGDSVCEGPENTGSCASDCPAPQVQAEQPAPPEAPTAPPAAGNTSRNTMLATVALLAAVAFAAWFLIMKKRSAMHK